MSRRVFDKAEIQRWLEWALLQDTDACLLWPFRVQIKGYPIYWDGQNYWLANRVICERTHGVAPDGWEAAHSCGVRVCCNKRHLSWKTHADNLEDRRGHGTLPMGTTHYISRLAEQQVRAIRRSRRTQAALAEIHGVAPSTIQAIKDGRSWKHLT